MTVTTTNFLLLRSALCVAILAMCLVMSQCTANDLHSATSAPAAPASPPTGDTDNADHGGETENEEVEQEESQDEEPELEEELQKVEEVKKVDDSAQLSDSQYNNGAKGPEGIGSGPAGSGGAGTGGQGIPSIPAAGGNSGKDKESIISSGGTSHGVNSTATETRAEKPNGQEQALSNDSTGGLSVLENHQQPPLKPPTEEKLDAKPIGSETTVHSTSVQTTKSTTSTATLTVSLQTLANSTTESTKGKSIEPANHLPKLPDAIPSLDKKEGSIGRSLFCALAVLSTLVVMAVAPVS